MNIKIKNTSAGELIKIIRKDTNLTQDKFAKKIIKSRDWLANKEINKVNIYINDFINILKTFNYEIIFISKDIELNLTKYKPNELIRYMRESTGKTQGDFAKSINKTNEWQYSIEVGRCNFYTNDLITLANIYNFEIIIKNK